MARALLYVLSPPSIDYTHTHRYDDLIMTARSFVFALLLGACVLSIGQRPALAQDGDAVFERLQQKYEALSSLRAEFTQTMSSAFSDQEATSSGTLVLSGDKYRVETSSQTLVTDGTTTYVYLPSEQQVLINKASNDESSFSPSEFLLNYDKRFNVSDVAEATVDGQTHYRLTLTPKRDDSFFQEATLWMRTRDAVITRLEVLDVNETRMTFQLENIQLDPALPADAFTFTPPEGVEVIDLRS
jgi:outer membrane lipoprotein carrier protein